MENPQTKKTETAADATESSKTGSQDWLGMGLAILTFLLGLGLLIYTFSRAAAMFAVPAREALGDGKDVTELGKSFGHVLLQIGLLFVMCIIGSVVSGVGVRLYLAARAKQGS